MTTTQPISVLLVEDERIVAKDLEQTLENYGYDVSGLASSAEEAISRASEHCPDVVLLDIRIKGRRDGVDTAALLQQRFDVPVVFLTAHADDATIDRAKRTEPYGYLIKPVKALEVRSAIEIAVFRHRMERRLRERERWFSTTLQSLTDAVLTTDLAGIVTFLNPAAELLTGTSARDAVGKRVHEVVRFVQPDASIAVETPFDAALRSMHPVQVSEARLLNAATGEERLIADGTAPVIQDGKTLGAVMVFRDITEQRKLQQRMEIADRLASLGAMAAGVAHEINNPLSAVTGNAEYTLQLVREQISQLESHGAPEAEAGNMRRALEAIEDMRTAGQRIARIVADLRTFSRGAPDSPHGSVEIVPTVQWAIRITAHELRDRAELITALGPTPKVRGDETRLGQIVVNLLINAAHAIAPGHAEQNRVTITTRTDHQGQAVIEVSDTGCGIPAQTLPRIFEPFFTTKDVSVGTGLGLSICHGIVTALGGRIEAESAVGKGTTMRVVLQPAADAPALEARELAANELERRLRILVIDDEPMLRNVLARLLGAHDVWLAASAEDALAMIESDPRFDVVFCDMMMPTMSGTAFFERLLERSPDLAKRVVFMTGAVVGGAASAALSSAGNFQLLKPFRRSELLAIVRAVLARAELAPVEPAS